MVKYNSKKRDPRLLEIHVAVCGDLPSACDYLLSLGVVNIDKYTDAVNMRQDNYDLILIYAPQGEGLMNTWVAVGCAEEENERMVPVRLLNEPTCHSALVELSSKIRRIVKEKFGVNEDESADETL